MGLSFQPNAWTICKKDYRVPENRWNWAIKSPAFFKAIVRLLNKRMNNQRARKISVRRLASFRLAVVNCSRSRRAYKARRKHVWLLRMLSFRRVAGRGSDLSQSGEQAWDYIKITKNETKKSRVGVNSLFLDAPRILTCDAWSHFECLYAITCYVLYIESDPD